MSKDIFCRSDFYDQVYYETKFMMVAYDITPALPGHSLVIPKRHVGSIEKLSRSEAVDLYKVLRKVIPALLRIYGANSYVFTAQVGRYSGRSVPHLHFHLIPRSKADKYQDKNERLYKLLKDDRAKIAYVARNREILRKRIEKDVLMLRKEFGYAGR
ncbi:MAG: HIT domain-containing protein [Candidatus Micrarchaeaceae archaeon]